MKAIIALAAAFGLAAILLLSGCSAGKCERPCKCPDCHCCPECHDCCGDPNCPKCPK